MSTATSRYQILIGGEFADAASGETMEVIAPATRETVAEVPPCGAEDVDRAVEAAQAAAPGWLETRRGTRRSSPPDAAVSRYGSVVLRSRSGLHELGTRLCPTSWASGPARALAGGPVPPSPTVVARSRDSFPTDPDGLGHPLRPGDDTGRDAGYLAGEVRKSLAQTTQGALSSH